VSTSDPRFTQQLVYEVFHTRGDAWDRREQLYVSVDTLKTTGVGVR
jgi:hypothetical protein